MMAVATDGRRVFGARGSERHSPQGNRSMLKFVLLCHGFLNPSGCFSEAVQPVGNGPDKRANLPSGTSPNVTDGINIPSVGCFTIYSAFP
jgi:hypothetical protein